MVLHGNVPFPAFHKEKVSRITAADDPGALAFVQHPKVIGILDKLVYGGGVAVHHKRAPTVIVRTDRSGDFKLRRPLFVGGGKSSVPAFLLNGVGYHITDTFFAVGGHHLRDGNFVKVHSVKILTNSGFNDVLAGDIRLQRRTVLFQFAMFEGIGGGVWIKWGSIHVLSPF